MKKILKKMLCLCICTSFIFSFGILTGCISEKTKPLIVCTMFSQYNWVREILGDRIDNFSVKYLLANGIDLHSYEPSIKDTADIINSDLFIYVGGESDDWAEDIVESSRNQINTIVLMDYINLVEEEDYEDSDDTHDENESHGEHGFDEHVWLSLKNAQILVNAITQAICEIDKENTAYIENANAYNVKLSLLDNEYKEAVQNGNKDTILFGDRFPFAYLIHDYGLNGYAAFPGCSAATEASYETIIFLARKVNELSLKVILITETSDGLLANTVKNATQTKDQQVFVMHAAQSISQTQINAGVTFFSIMTDNLAILKKALE